MKIVCLLLAVLSVISLSAFLTTAPTRTWTQYYFGPCQSGTAGTNIIWDTANGPSPFICPAGTLDGGWQVNRGVTSGVFYLRYIVPPGQSGSYTLTIKSRTSDISTADSYIFTPSYNCRGDGDIPNVASMAFTPLPAIALHPKGMVNATITNTYTVPMVCSAGEELYLRFPTATMGYTAPIHFSFIGLATQGAM